MENYFIMDNERETRLWQDALIVFDTNSICAMYRMTKETQKTMLDVLDYLKDRLWIPGHVIYEYKKNRKEVIDEPIRKFYINPDFFNSNYKQQLNDFIKKIENHQYYHPYFDEDKLSDLKKSSEDVGRLIDSIRDLTKNEFEKRKKEIQDIKDVDGIYDKVQTFNSGEEFSYAEKIEIMKEGEWRYKQELPPGYKDYSEKHGMQKYGDLIIWKEVLRKASNDHCSIIFITNDVKEDWYEEHPKKQNPTCPRHELIQEFMEATGGDVWLYTLDQFVEKIIEVFKDKTSLPFYTGLDALKDVLINLKRQKELEEIRNNTQIIRVTCDNCDHHFTVNKRNFDFCWESNGSYERSMGPETEYICTESFECPECGNECNLKFHVWEYPVGAYNNDTIEEDGCTIETGSIDLSEHISFYDDEDGYEESETLADFDEDGLYPDFDEEIEREIESKD